MTFKTESFTWSKSVTAGIASGGKLCVVTSSTENEGIFGGKGFFHQADFAFSALETVLVPMEIFVGHVLGIESDSAVADSTCVGEILLVTRNATWMLIGQDVAVPGQTFVTGNADKMLGMEIFSQSLPRKELCDKI